MISALKLYKTLFPKLELTALPGLYLQRPWNIMRAVHGLCRGSTTTPLEPGLALWPDLARAGFRAAFRPLAAGWNRRFAGRQP